jgi:hypothetical protein
LPILENPVNSKCGFVLMGRKTLQKSSVKVL